MYDEIPIEIAENLLACVVYFIVFNSQMTFSILICAIQMKRTLMQK